jgi:TetR/AcrR family fatty acid metabolism transcriptional regulator
MEDLRDKKAIILDAATKVFAREGYYNAKISDISNGADIAAGLIYFYFKNGKMDLLLSITLRFWKKFNAHVEEKTASIQNSIDKLKKILTILQDMLMTKESLALAKVLNEALPVIYTVKNKELKAKRKEISIENRKFLKTIDDIIMEGQKQSVFDKSLNPSIMRQILYGAVEMVLYGLFLKYFRKEEIGYNQTDARIAIERLIYKFLAI